MKTINICFVDFWNSFNENENVFIDTLKKHFEVKIVNPKDAQYVFYSLFGRDYLRLSRDKIFIFCTPENLCPDFNVCDYAIGFDMLDYGDRYFRMPYYVSKKYRHLVNLAESKHKSNNIELLRQKTKFCSITVSNKGCAVSRREEFFNLLVQYKMVDSGGRWNNNIGGPVRDKYTFDIEHKFSIAFENSSRPGYTTEKIIEAFAAKTIPIYWGDPEISKYFNERSFINANGYESFTDVIEIIKEIDNDDDLYMSYINQPIYLNGQPNIHDYLCDLEKFLVHMMSQPIDIAQRKNNSYHGERIYLEQVEFANFLRVKKLIDIPYKVASWIVSNRH